MGFSPHLGCGMGLGLPPQGRTEPGRAGRSRRRAGKAPGRAPAPARPRCRGGKRRGPAAAAAGAALPVELPELLGVSEGTGPGGDPAPCGPARPLRARGHRAAPLPRLLRGPGLPPSALGCPPLPLPSAAAGRPGAPGGFGVRSCFLSELCFSGGSQRRLLPPHSSAPRRVLLWGCSPQGRAAQPQPPAVCLRPLSLRS